MIVTTATIQGVNQASRLVAVDQGMIDHDGSCARVSLAASVLHAAAGASAPDADLPPQ
jgi:hypothetical protein